MTPLNVYLFFSGNFGNLIDGVAPPPSKKKLEDVSLTTPLLDTTATMTCKSTTIPERPLFGDAQRCSDQTTLKSLYLH